jgi:hypothetical protein
LYYINHIISLRGEAWCHKKSLTLPLFIEVFVPNQKVSIMYLCSGMSTCGKEKEGWSEQDDIGNE